MSIESMSIENDMKVLAKMTRAQISNKNRSGKDGKDGQTFIATGPSGREYAIKMFKSKKATAVINKEYDFQYKAASKGAAPAVYAKNTTQKYIIMQKMKETIVDYKRREVGYDWWEMPRSLQAQLYALCVRLDAAQVVQNDGNPLNLMLDDSGRLHIIDYGLATKIDRKMLNKRGPQPNVNLTLWHFQRQLKYYKIQAPLLKEIQDKYMKAFNNNGDYTDEKLLAEGNRALNNGEASSSSRGQASTKYSKKSIKKSIKKSSSQQLTRKSSPTVSTIDSDMEAGASLTPNRSRVAHFRNFIQNVVPAKRKPHRESHPQTPTKKRDIKKLLKRLKKGTSVKFVVDNKTKVYNGIFVAYTESQDLCVEISHKGKTFYLRIDQLREIDNFKIIRL